MRTISGRNKIGLKKYLDKPKANLSQTKKKVSMEDDPDSITSLRTTMEGISQQIQALQNDLKADLRSFKDDITMQVKREVSELRVDIDQKSHLSLKKYKNKTGKSMLIRLEPKRWKRSLWRLTR